ncbi:retinol dehydrogenase 14-like isoform X4 [Scylla paramamosain]|uniref:retinol dehydrogenase 14-like isoform X4 n=1 Tax=Scylla paramamosain TaxID=85552 RepID=UPI003083913A
MASVTAFAKRVIRDENRLDLLVLAAGRGAPPSRTVTAEDLEVTLASNHLGHFLLVNLLLGLMVKSYPCRVIVKASSAHYLLSSINPKDLNLSGGSVQGSGSLLPLPAV